MNNELKELGKTNKQLNITRFAYEGFYARNMKETDNFPFIFPVRMKSKIFKLSLHKRTSEIEMDCATMDMCQRISIIK